MIRRSQFDALRQSVEGTFEARLISFLHEQFPETEAADESQLRVEIRAQINASQSYGLETEQQIATYTVTAYALGTDFDKRFLAAQQVLTSEFFSAEEKTKWLENWTRALFESLEEAG